MRRASDNGDFETLRAVVSAPKSLQLVPEALMRSVEEALLRGTNPERLQRTRDLRLAARWASEALDLARGVSYALFSVDIGGGPAPGPGPGPGGGVASMDPVMFVNISSPGTNYVFKTPGGIPVSERTGLRGSIDDIDGICALDPGGLLAANPPSALKRGLPMGRLQAQLLVGLGILPDGSDLDVPAHGVLDVRMV